MAVLLVGGLLVLGLLGYNVLLILQGPSYTAEMRAPDEHGVSTGQYHDARGTTLDIDDAVRSLEAATSTYYRAVPVDQGSQVVNGSGWINDLDHSSRELAESPALENPEIRELYDAYVEQLELYREARGTLVGAADETAPVLAVCNPYALPVHTPRELAGEEALTGCVESMTSIGETGDPVVDAMIADSLPALQDWVAALDPDSAEADVARDAYLAAFTGAATTGLEEMAAVQLPMEESFTKLTTALDGLSELPR